MVVKKRLDPAVEVPGVKVQHHGKHVLITVFSVVRLLGLGHLVGAICVWNER